jgi:hypothetical protein
MRHILSSFQKRLTKPFMPFESVRIILDLYEAMLVAEIDIVLRRPALPDDHSHHEKTISFITG